MINQTLTNVYKNILKSNGLVNSGKLLNSILVETNLINNNLSINVKSLPYLIYLTDEYQLTKQFINSKEFTIEIENEFLPLIEKIISDTIEGIPVTNIEPNVVVLYNGK